MKPNRKVYLTINASVPPSIILPELRDITVRQVMSRIESYGIHVSSFIYRTAQCNDCVVGVMYNGKVILPGTQIKKGSSISLVIGRGLMQKNVMIPDLNALNIKQVEQKLNSLGLDFGQHNFDKMIVSSEDRINAFVYKQIPTFEVGKMISQNDSISLFFTLDSSKVWGEVIVDSNANGVIIE